jgi:hypothetical protein
MVTGYPRTTNEDEMRAVVQDWFNRTVTAFPYYSTSLDELLRYVLSVWRATDPASNDYAGVKPYLTHRCTECNVAVIDMTESETDEHIVVNGNVVVGCEWYWIVNPTAVGVRAQDGSGYHWIDWATGPDRISEDIPHWIRTGKLFDESGDKVVTVSSPEVSDDAPLGLLRQIHDEVLEQHPRKEVSNG